MLGSNVTITCSVSINNSAADVTLGGANSFKNLQIYNGTAEGSSFPTDTGAATTSHFGNASSGTIVLGLSGTSGTLIYNGNTAATPKTFTYDCRSSGANTIEVSTPGQTLTLIGNLLYSSGSSQTAARNWNFGGAGNLTINAAISNAAGSSYPIGIVKNDAGTLTLGGTNAYSGDTIVNGGTLALTGNGSISNTANIVMAGGTMMDVSGLSSPFVLGTSQTLRNSGTAQVLLKGNINASKGTIAFSTDGSTPAFAVTNGTVTLSSNTTFSINSVKLAPESYPFIAALAGGSVAGTVPAVTLSFGSGHLQINGGRLDLVVDTVPYGPTAYYISPSGSDITGDGSLGNPWQTVAMARDYLAANVYQTNDITVYLRGGRYALTNTITFTSSDSGINGYYITYRSYPGETATISGGKQVTGWTQVPGKPYWVASVLVACHHVPSPCSPSLTA